MGGGRIVLVSLFLLWHALFGHEYLEADGDASLAIA
jgi:hypothetical protein